jgi:hypothetical protein
MNEITYQNKVALNENPEIADINKVTDDDMNEIKSVVNGNSQISSNNFGLGTDTWSSSATYSIGDIVVYNDNTYKNLTGTNTTTTPDQDNTNWEVMPLILNVYNTSTKNAYSSDYVNKLQEKGTANINTFSSTDQTSTGTSTTTLANSSSTITTKGGKMLIIANANCYNTGAGFFFTIEIKIDESSYAIVQSNQATNSAITGSKIIDLPAGTHDVSMSIHGTNESSSIRVPSYTGYGYSIVEL